MYNVNAKTVEENANLSNVVGQQLDLITRTTGIRIAREIKRIYEKRKIREQRWTIDSHCISFYR